MKEGVLFTPATADFSALRTDVDAKVEFVKVCTSLVFVGVIRLYAQCGTSCSAICLTHLFVLIFAAVPGAEVGGVQG